MMDAELRNITKQAALAAFIRHPTLLPEDALPVKADHTSPTILVQGTDLVPELLEFARAQSKNRYFLTFLTEDDIELEPKEFSSWHELQMSDEGDTLRHGLETESIRGYGYLIIRPAPLLPLIGGFTDDDMKDPSDAM